MSVSFSISLLGVLLFALSFAAALEDQDTVCRKNGDICYVHWDCCSRMCMTYNNKCVAKAGDIPYPSDQMVTVFRRPLSSKETDQGTGCGKGGDICHLDSDCCSEYCKTNSSKCAEYPHLIDMGFTQIWPEFGVKEHVKLEDPNDQMVTGTKNSLSSKGTEKQCRNVGERCSTSEECCTMRCHSYLHKCVT
ncbi:hypothetical protein KR009_005339 [Drosophila setifemur]|nr:hypothetical protein KR009_005339 [Drosophila setifemur]